MRIVWGGPWNDRCAVAASSAAIVDRLIAVGHALEILRTEVGETASLPSLARSIPVRFWGDVDVYQLARHVDIVIVNFCNRYACCGAMLGNVDLIGPVGIFHDSVLARLAVDWACSSPFADAALRCIVLATYGQSAWKRGEPFLSDARSLARRRPMLEWFASGVCGAVVHSGQDEERLRGVCPGPVSLIAPVGHSGAVAYVDALLPLVDEALNQRPTMMAGLALGRSIARTTGPAAGDPAVDRIGMTLRDLLGSDAK